MQPSAVWLCLLCNPTHCDHTFEIKANTHHVRTETVFKVRPTAKFDTILAPGASCEVIKLFLVFESLK